MIYDIFTFNNELEMLEIRLSILDKYVDKFVIVEATETFSREKKPLYFKDNINMFNKWKEKIHHHIIDKYDDVEILKVAYDSDNTGNKELHWIYEFYQKEKIKDAIKDLEDDDICFISDVDEIWNPEVIGTIGDGLYKPRQNLTYIYYLNQRTSENWTYFTGTILTRYKNIKDKCLNHLRTHKKNKYIFIESGGWHFNALGGMEQKIDAFKHPVYTQNYMKSREMGARIDEEGLPKYLLDNRDKYKHLFKS